MKKKIKADTPRLPDKLTMMDIGDVQHEEVYENCVFQDGLLTNKELEKVVFRHCKFSNVTFENIQFYQLDMIDCVFENCNMANAELIGAIIHRSLFENTKLIGANFADSTMKDIQFKHCINTYTSYHYATLNRVLFEETILDESDFQELNWKKLHIIDCSLHQANFTNTNMHGLDLSNSRFENLIFSKELIQGVIIHPMQALTICSGIGVEIDDGGY